MMFSLYSSDSSVRYLQDVLDCIAFPQGQIVQFRYDIKYVEPRISLWTKHSDGRLRIPREFDRSAQLIYAERQAVAPSLEFSFYPFRLARIIQIRQIGSALYVDLRLQEFPSYESGVDAARHSLAKVTEAIQAQPMYPLPPLLDRKGLIWRDGVKVHVDGGTQASSGYFFRVAPPNQQNLVRVHSDDQRSWEQVVEVLGSTKEFAASTFFRLAGIRRARPWWLRWFGSYDGPVKQSTRFVESEYWLPAGAYAIVACRSYRPRSSPHRLERIINVTAEGDGFVGAWPQEIMVDSRYNEQRVILACKRVLDAIISPIVFSIASDSPSLQNELKAPRVIGPRVLLLMRVYAPRWIVSTMFVCFILGTIILSLGPDSYLKLFNTYQRLSGFVGWEGVFAAGGKLLGGFITAFGAYLGFRRLPLRS
jgi:hypothetical protein